MKSKLFLILCLIFLISFVSSALPHSSINIFNFNEGYTIISNPQNILKYNQSYQFNFFVYNTSTGFLIDNESIECIVYVAGNDGNVLFYSEVDFLDGYWNK